MNYWLEYVQISIGIYIAAAMYLFSCIMDLWCLNLNTIAKEWEGMNYWLEDVQISIGICITAAMYLFWCIMDLWCSDLKNLLFLPPPFLLFGYLGTLEH